MYKFPLIRRIHPATQHRVMNSLGNHMGASLQLAELHVLVPPHPWSLRSQAHISATHSAQPRLDLALVTHAASPANTHLTTLADIQCPSSASLPTTGNRSFHAPQHQMVVTTDIAGLHGLLVTHSHPPSQLHMYTHHVASSPRTRTLDSSTPNHHVHAHSTPPRPITTYTHTRLLHAQSPRTRTHSTHPRPITTTTLTYCGVVQNVLQRGATLYGKRCCRKLINNDLPWK